MPYLRKSLTRDPFLRHLSDSPHLLSFMEANFNGENKAVRERLGELVDESDYELRDWIQSLSIIGHWLDSHSMQMPLDDQVGYVCCAVEAIGAGATFEDLPNIVREMLEKYGCDRAVKK